MTHRRRTLVPQAVQAAGLAAACAGVWLLLGLGACLLVGGLALTAIGALAEGGRL